MTKIEEFLKICRACNSEKTNLLNLFASDCDNEPTLGEKLTSCTSLTLIEHDDLPQHICYSCAKLLEEAFKFNRMCRNTDTNLRTRLLNLKADPDIAESVEEADNFCEVETLDSPGFLDESLGDEFNVFSSSKSLKQEIPDDVEVLEGEDIPAVQKKLSSPPHVYLEEAGDRQYVCNECDKKFFTSKALELHNKIHHKRQTKTKFQANKPQRQSSLEECTDCDLLFGTREEYRDHLRTYHSNERDDNTCEICGKRLRNKIAFRNHLKVHEAENRHFPCKVCGKEYTEYRYMYRHMLYHKSTLFRCKENGCKRTYNVKHKLVDHLKRHHQIFLRNTDVRKIQPERLERDDGERDGTNSDDNNEN